MFFISNFISLLVFCIQTPRFCSPGGAPLETQIHQSRLVCFAAELGLLVSKNFFSVHVNYPPSL